MSRIFPSNKDHIIDDIDDQYNLCLSDEEYDRLRKCTESELLLFTIILARAIKNIKDKEV